MRPPPSPPPGALLGPLAAGPGKPGRAAFWQWRLPGHGFQVPGKPGSACGPGGYQGAANAAPPRPVHHLGGHLPRPPLGRTAHDATMALKSLHPPACLSSTETAFALPAAPSRTLLIRPIASARRRRDVPCSRLVVASTSTQVAGPRTISASASAANCGQPVLRERLQSTSIRQREHDYGRAGAIVTLSSALQGPARQSRTSSAIAISRERWLYGSTQASARISPPAYRCHRRHRRIPTVDWRRVAHFIRARLPLPSRYHAW